MNIPCLASPERYSTFPYRRSGRSGLKLPAVSLGLWHNFGGTDRVETGREVVRTAFDHEITHFDLANNYGPPPGSAEETFGALLRSDLNPYRDELIISSKAGYTMWPGPHGAGLGAAPRNHDLGADRRQPFPADVLAEIDRVLAPLQ